MNKTKRTFPRVKYDPLTRQYAKFLYPLIDRVDWAYIDKGGYLRNCQNYILEGLHNATPGCYPDKLTQTHLQSFLNRRYQLHYLSSRKSDTILVCIDVDAHDGQTDAIEQAQFIQSKYIPSSYLEPSTGGAHVYFLLTVPMMKRVDINRLLDELAAQLRIICSEHLFTCGVEVMGGFTTFDDSGNIQRGQTVRLPMLLDGERSLQQLTALTPVSFNSFRPLSTDCSILLDGNPVNPPNTLPDVSVSWTPNPTGNYRKSDDPNAFTRMNICCFDFTIIHRRLPDADELLEAYAGIYGPDTPDGLRERTRRAADAIKQRSKTFDEVKAGEAGYGFYRDELFKAVQSHCIDRTSKYPAEITDEDLAIALYTYTRCSFRIADTPDQQWGVSPDAVSQMFVKLRDEGMTTRGGSNRNKVIALRTILERAGLVECIDPLWKYGGSKLGICKKWVIANKHWRYRQFVRFAENVAVNYIHDTETSGRVIAS